VQNTREFLGLWHSGHIFLSRGLATDTGPPETLVRWSGTPANGMVRPLLLPRQRSKLTRGANDEEHPMSKKDKRLSQCGI
jgi:hypothetical protein